MSNTLETITVSPGDHFRQVPKMIDQMESAIKKIGGDVVNTGVEVMRGSLAAWSWGEIQAIYEILGQQLLECKRTAEFLHPEQHISLKPKPGEIIPLSDLAHALWIGAWHRSVARINDQLTCLDKEIARRNNLIGVMG